jgi:hypothetical protein
MIYKDTVFKSQTSSHETAHEIEVEHHNSLLNLSHTIVRGQCVKRVLEKKGDGKYFYFS